MVVIIEIDKVIIWLKQLNHSIRLPVLTHVSNISVSNAIYSVKEVALKNWSWQIRI